MALGRYPAALAAMLYWISNPLWVGGTLSVTAIATFFAGSPNAQIGGSVLSNTIFRIVVALIFIWGVTWSAILSLRVGKWLSVFGSYCKFALIALFVVLSLAYLFSGHPTNLTVSNLLPSSNWFPIFAAVIPLLFFNWAGILT